MSHGGIEFTGDWTARERRRVERWVYAIDVFLCAHMPSPWRFEKSAGAYAVAQPSLCAEFTRPTLDKLIRRLRYVAEQIAPGVTYGE